MDFGPAQLVEADLLASRDPDHLRAGNEHVAEVLDHEDEVRDRGRVDGATGAWSGDHRDLRHHAGGLDVPVEDVGISGQADDPFLDAGTARIVDPQAGTAGPDGQVHHLADFLGEHLTQRSAKHAGVMREDEDVAAVDRAVAGDDAVTWDLFLAHSKGLCPVHRKGIEFGKGSRIDQKLDTLTRRELAFRVLLVVGIAAPVHRVVLALPQQVDLALRR